MMKELKPLFNSATKSQSNISFVGKVNGVQGVILGIYPDASSASDGLAVMIYMDRLETFFGVTEAEVRKIIGDAPGTADTWDSECTSIMP